MSDLVQTVADYFVETGQAHHQAFIETDGADPEWPLWYATHMQSKLSQLLGHDFTKSTLVYELIHLDKTYAATAPNEPWPVNYAKYLINKYKR